MPYLFRYMGGKTRQAKTIATILETYRKDKQPYVEPFVGAGSVILRMSGLRLGFDIHEPLIAYWRAAQSGWLPPKEVTEEEYKNFMEHPDKYSLPTQAFIGFACSFGAKWRGGYAREEGVNFAERGLRATKSAAPYMRDVAVGQKDYKELCFTGCLIYCDPPYSNTTEYSNSFCSTSFWKTMGDWAEDNTVFVTEFSCSLPSYRVEIVHEFNRKSTFNSQDQTVENIEKLYRIKSSKELCQW